MVWAATHRLGIEYSISAYSYLVDKCMVGGKFLNRNHSSAFHHHRHCTFIDNEETANKSIASAKVAVAVFLQQVVGGTKVWPEGLGKK